MAVKREDDRYSADPMDDLAGLVERVEGAKKPGTEATEANGATEEDSPGPAPLRMKVTGDLRDAGKKRRR